MNSLFISPIDSFQLRIAWDTKIERNILQQRIIGDLGDQQWESRYRDTIEEEREEMEIFLLINLDTALIQKPQNLYLEELQLENGHLIGGHIDICLWPTKEGEKPDPVLITEY